MTAAPGQRRTVHYVGRVQGVGFRYTAVHLAQRFPVCGCVRNLPNGEVELIVEGREADVDAFLAAVARAMHENITDCRIETGEPTGEFDGFDLRR